MGLPAPMSATAVRCRSLTGHSGPTPQFDPSWSVLWPVLVVSAVVLPIAPPLIAVGFSPSKQLLNRDFSFHHDGGEGGRGRARRGGKEPNRARGDQAEWVEGWMRWRTRTRREDRLSSWAWEKRHACSSSNLYVGSTRTRRSSLCGKEPRKQH